MIVIIKAKHYFTSSKQLLNFLKYNISFYFIEVPTLRHGLQIETLQDQTHLMLQEYCAHVSSKELEHDGNLSASANPLSLHTSSSPQLSLNRENSNSKARFGKLLLILPTLNGISPRTIETLFFRKTVGNIKVEKVIADLFQGIQPFHYNGVDVNFFYCIHVKFQIFLKVIQSVLTHFYCHFNNYNLIV